MNGVLILDKPAGFTSFDAVAVIRGLARERKIGHTGTLDPMATGVLPLLLGRTAKAAELLPDTNKEYCARFRLGERRDTGDVTGKLVETDETPVSREALETALEPFRGEILQTPPMVSAVSVGGKRLYELARQGIEVERQPRPVTVLELALTDYDETERTGELRVRCSKGTYVRVLIEDIARAAGTCGVMTALRRTLACGFSQEQARTLDELRALAAEGALEQALLPADALFSGFPQVQVTGPQAARFLNGGALSLNRLQLGQRPAEGQPFRVYDPERCFLGLAAADREREELRMVKLLKEVGA